MASELFVNKITGTSGTSGGAPITLSGDTATLGSGATFSGTVSSSATLSTKPQTYTVILAANFVNGSGFNIATGMTVTIPKNALIADGTTKFLASYHLSADGGGNSPFWAYTITGGMTVSQTNIVAASNAINFGAFSVNIPSGIASDVTINIGTLRAGGNNNTAYNGSRVHFIEVPR